MRSKCTLNPGNGFRIAVGSIAVAAVERVIPISTPADLAKRFRQNADDCDRAAVTDIDSIGRQRLLKTAALYRSLANQIDIRPDLPRNVLNAAPPRPTGRAHSGTTIGGIKTR